MGGCRAVLEAEHIAATGILHDEWIGGMGGIRAVLGLGGPEGWKIAYRHDEGLWCDAVRQLRGRVG
jgi:hypothetical protein